MESDDLIQKKIRLGDELDNSIKQIIYGLKELQISLKETSYFFITFQLLASGIERLMKCAICYGSLHLDDQFPQKEIYTHDITELLQKFRSKYFKTGSKTALVDDLKFLTQDVLLQSLIDSLSKFGNYARYYNLNVVTGAPKILNIEDIWDELQKKFISSRPDLMEKLVEEPDYKMVDNEISNYLVSCFEKFVRAIVRQFTLGDMGDEPKRYIGSYYHFLTLSDDKIGNTDYFDKFFKKEIKNPIAFSSSDSTKRKTIDSKDYNSLWPFITTNSVIVQKHQNSCLTVVINNMTYALNGMAMQILKLPTPFEANIAYVGRSLRPFIDAANSL
ncbi:MAG: hypothetical protein JEY71_11770 [Sphaerochaeta sp.]|nr:hypothetical protein [Sphaerochaeta sp.]